MFVIAAARNNGLVLQLLTEENSLRTDEGVATVAVTQNRDALRYVDQSIRGVVKQAIVFATERTD